MSDVEEFKKNICKAAGHDFFKDVSIFADVCNRCGFTEHWSLNRHIAASLAIPLKENLSYGDLSRKLLKVDKIDIGDYPLYDNDFPDQKT